ncbi:MAG: PAS domain S-box protein [Symploca sp. SIO2E9]|nr:PAS domain S-box protein [Symploca sp. SIO2E9]
MTSKLITFHCSEALAQAIEKKSQAAGIDENTLVTEVLASAFEVSTPSLVLSKKEKLEQRLHQFEAQGTLLLETLTKLCQENNGKGYSLGANAFIELFKKLITRLQISQDSNSSRSNEVVFVNKIKEELGKVAVVNDQKARAPSQTAANWDNFSSIQNIGSNIDTFAITAMQLIENQQRQKELWELEKKYRNLFELTNDSILIVDSESHRLLNANWNAARRLGYTRAELLEFSIEDISVPIADNRKQAILHELQSNGNIIFEHAYCHKNGTEVPVEISAQVIEYEGSLAYQCFLRDISERKQAEVQFKRHQEILQTIFDHIPIMICFWDADGKIQLTNQEMERTLGWSFAEILNIDLLVECYPHPEYHQMVIEWMRGEASGWNDFQTKTRDGKIIDTSWAKIKLSDGTSIGIGQDTSERKQIEKKLRQTHAELEKRSQSELMRVNEQLQQTLEELKVTEEELRINNQEIVKDYQEIQIQLSYYQDLVNLAPVSYLVTDTQGVIQEANQAAAAMLCCKREFLIGKPLRLLIPSPERRAFINHLKQLHQEKWQEIPLQQIHNCQLNLKPHKSDPFTVMVKVNAKQNRQGLVVGFCWLMCRLNL